MDTLKGLLSKLAGGESNGYSRKWLALVLSAVMLYMGKMDQSTFSTIALAYLAAQGAADAVTSWRNGKAPVEPPKP